MHYTERQKLQPTSPSRTNRRASRELNTPTVKTTPRLVDYLKVNVESKNKTVHMEPLDRSNLRAEIRDSRIVIKVVEDDEELKPEDKKTHLFRPSEK